MTVVADFLPAILAFLLGLTWGLMGPKGGRRIVIVLKAVANPFTVEIEIENTSGDPPTAGSPDALTSAGSPDELPSGEVPPGEKDSPESPGGRDPGSPGSGGGDGVT